MRRIHFTFDQNNDAIVTSPEEIKGKTLPKGLISAHFHRYSDGGDKGFVDVPLSALSNGDLKIVGVKEETWEQTKMREAHEDYVKKTALDKMMTTHAIGGPSQEWIDQPEGFQLLKGEEKDQPRFPEDVKAVEDFTNDDEVFPEDVEMESLPSLLDGHSNDCSGFTETAWYEGSDGYADTPDSRIASSHSVVFGQPLPSFLTEPTPGTVTDKDCLFGAEGVLYVLGFIPRPNKNGSVHRWYHPVLGDDKPDNHLLFDLETDTMEMLGVKIFRLGAKLGTRALKYQIQNTLEQH